MIEVKIVLPRNMVPNLYMTGETLKSDLGRPFWLPMSVYVTKILNVIAHVL